MGQDDMAVIVAFRVAAVPKLAEVDPVAQHRPHARRGHLQPVGDPYDRHAGEHVTRRAAHILRAGLVDLQPARDTLEPPVRAGRTGEDVAARQLALTPDPRIDGLASPDSETVDVFLTFADGVGEVNVSDEPAVRRRRVEVFRGAMDVSAGTLDAIPYLEARPRARQSRQVCDNDPAVLAALDPLDRVAQTRAVVDRQPAAHVEFGFHERDRWCATQAGHVALDVGDLIGVGVVRAVLLALGDTVR